MPYFEHMLDDQKRLVSNMLPDIIRKPTGMTFWGEMPFSVDWKGMNVEDCISREVLDDLRQHTVDVSDSIYLQTFGQHRRTILNAVAKAMDDSGDFDNTGG